MKKIEVNKILNDGFSIKLKKIGFVKKKSEFILQTNSIYYRFSYSIVNSDNSFPAQFSLGVGFKIVRSILKKIEHPHYKNPLNEYVPIIGLTQAELFETTKYPIFEYDIYTKEDALKMIDDVVEYLSNFGVPYLKSLSNLRSIEKHINSRLNRYLGDFGLVLAKLTNGKNYETIKKTYQKMSIEWSKYNREKLETVIDYLDSKSEFELYQISNYDENLNKNENNVIAILDFLNHEIMSITEKPENYYTDIEKIKNIIEKRNVSRYKGISNILSSLVRQLYDNQIWNENINLKTEELNVELEKLN